MYRIEILRDGSWAAIHGSGCLGEHLAEAKMVQSSNAIGSLTLDLLPTSSAAGTIGCNTRVRVLNEQTGEYDFYGRVIDVEPGMDEDGTMYTEAVCEDALGFLQDTSVWIDSRKTYFDGGNPKYPVEIDPEDDTREIGPETLARLVIGQHNNTVGDSGGDAWKKVKVGTVSIPAGTTTEIDAEYEATTYEMLSDVAEDADFEYRSRYDGTDVYIDMATQLGAEAGTFAVGDNLASTALKTSMADVVTRLFPYGDEYAKLEKTVRKGVKVSGALKGNTWQSKGGTMVRFPVGGALKCVLTVGARNKDYAMVFFTDKKLSEAGKDKSDAILKKYTTKAKATGANLVRRYPVPEDAKYVYVYGADSKCTTYGYYKNSSGAEVKKHYRTDLAFWKKYLTDAQLDAILKAHGVSIGSVVDGSNDRSYFLRRNEDKYGAVEGTVIIDKQLNTKKITNARKAVYSVTDFNYSKAKWARKAKSFVKRAAKELKSRCDESVELTVTGYDLAEAGLDYDALKLYDTWRVTNQLCGIDHMAEVVRIERDLLQPWEVSVELGSKVTRASSSDRPSCLGGGVPSDYGDDDDSTEDEYAALTGQLADAAEEAAGKAVEKADELDEVSYRIQVDSLAAGQMASDAYDSVHPITEAMRGALEDAEEQASQLTAVKESQSQTIQTSNALARAVATYSYETEKSVVRWKQTYTASLDAWASDDPETQAKIKAAYAKLYGESGTADNPTADSAQGHLNAAKAANVEATAKEAEMKTELASANAYQSSCSSAAKKAQASYEKALANYKALKKKTKAKRKQIDAAHTALNAAIAKRDKSQAAVDAANTRCAEAEQSYADAKAALAAAEAKVEAASAEVDTAMNGIHQLYSSTIEQTAKGIRLTAEKTEAQEKKLGQLEVTADSIKSDVQTMDEKTGALMKATNMTQTDSGWTWSIVDNTARKDAADAASDAASASSEASSAKAAANEVKTIVRTFSGGVFVGKYPNTVGALINANGSFDVINVNWTDNKDGTYTPSESSVCASFGNSAVLNGTVFAKRGITLSDTDVHSEGSYPPGHSGSGLFASGVGIMTGSGGSNHGMWSTNNGTWIIYSNGSETKVPQNLTGSGWLGTESNRWSRVYASKMNVSNLTTTSDGSWLGVLDDGGFRKKTSSSKRWKHDICELSDANLSAELLYDIPVKQYVFNEDYLDETDSRYLKTVPGLIAEDVDEVYPIAVNHDSDGRASDWDERYIVPPMLKLIQDQKRQIDDLTARVATLEGSVSAPPATA